jgi:hypothetical protein
MAMGCAVVLAVAAALGMGWMTRSLTRDAAGPGRKRAILLACVFPLFCLAWTVAVFVFQAYINESFRDRDAGLGSTWHTPLPNGYALSMMDVPDYGSVYNQRLKTGSAPPAEGEGSIAGVRLLQVSGSYILGAADSNWSSRTTDRKGDSNVSFYFLIDTQAGHRADFHQLEELRSAAAKSGVSLELQPILSVYRRYRYTWFELVILTVELLPILLFIALLGRLIVKLRRTRPAVIEYRLRS